MPITESYLIECPRCGFLTCEANELEEVCQNCLYQRLLSRLPDSDGGMTEESAADVQADFQETTFGDLIEQVPHNITSWNLVLTNERKLKMIEQFQPQITNEETPKRESPPYELVAYPDDFKGTTWIKHGVAWPTKDGKRLRIKLFTDKPLPENGKLLLVESLRSTRHRTESTPF